MTVALDVQRTSPKLIAEIRAACKALNLDIEEWTGGIPRTPPQLVMTALEPGERRLPDDLCQLIEASPGLRAIVFASEPLVKPRITLNQGRVVILAPPVDRVRLIAVARSALGTDERMSPRTEASLRFEILRRQYWVAWARGTESAKIALNEQTGMTVSIGAATSGHGVARVFGEKSVEATRGAKLADRLRSDGAVVHLVDDASEWQIYWPQTSPIWICSPNRLPTRWEATMSIQGAPSSWLRLAAFPGDQIIGLWGDVPEAALAPIRSGMVEGGPETLAALAQVVELYPTLAGIVVELR